MMKRDWDIIREILQKVEDLEPNKTLSAIDFDNSKTDVFNYHIKLMYEAGLIDAIDCCSDDRDEYLIRNLSWEGHEFLDSIRNESVWNKTKEFIKDKSGSMTFEIVKLISLGILKTSLGLPS